LAYNALNPVVWGLAPTYCISSLRFYIKALTGNGFLPEYNNLLIDLIFFSARSCTFSTSKTYKLFDCRVTIFKEEPSYAMLHKQLMGSNPSAGAGGRSMGPCKKTALPFFHYSYFGLITR
jgi:hypothetical protein